MLDVSAATVAAEAGLLRVLTRDGRRVYPLIQFDGARPVAGLAQVPTILSPVLAPVTIAAWLTSPQPSTGQRRPVDLLRAGQVADVLQAARSLASSSD